jgi:putative acetyltransferase
LVAEVDGEVVGHLAFSPVTVQSGTKSFGGVGLGPVAVLPPFQGQGIGSRLIQRGLVMLCERGERAVFVLGHAEYYPRFGFRPSKYFGIGCEFPVPEEIFMALELQPGALDNVSGTIHYAPEFHDVT